MKRHHRSDYHHSFALLFFVFFTATWGNYVVLHIAGLARILFSSPEQPASGMSYYTATLAAPEMANTAIYGLDYFLLNLGIISPFVFTASSLACFLWVRNRVVYFLSITGAVLFGFLPDLARTVWFTIVSIFFCNIYWYCHAWRGSFYFLIAWGIIQFALWIGFFCTALGLSVFAEETENASVGGGSIKNE